MARFINSHLYLKHKGEFKPSHGALSIVFFKKNFFHLVNKSWSWIVWLSSKESIKRLFIINVLLLLALFFSFLTEWWHLEGYIQLFRGLNN